MNIITFDLGSSMAYAHNLDGFPHVEHKTFPGSRVERAAATFTWLEARLENDAERDTVVVFERPFARGRDATRCLWGLANSIEVLAQLNGLPVVDIDPSSIKKWATGSGKADKPAMIAAAQRLGYQGDNEHEADAFLLLLYAEANLTQE